MALVVFISFFGFNFAQPVLPLYVRELGVTDVGAAALWTGLMLGVSPLLAAVCAPLWGSVADRYGRKRMVQRSLVAFAVITALMGVVQSVLQLFALRVVMGLFAGFTSMAMAYAVTVTPSSRTSAALGLLQSAQMAALIGGPIAAGLVADRAGLRGSFFAASFTIALGFVVMSLLTQDDRALRPTLKQAASRAERSTGPVAAGVAKRERSWALVRLPGFLPILVVLFLAQFVDRSFGPILPLYVAELGVAPDRVASYAGLVISLAALATAVSASTVGHLATRLAPQRLLLAALAAGAALCLPLAVARTPGELLAARVGLGLFAGGALTLAFAAGARELPEARKGAGLGLLSSAGMLGSASSPIVTGALAQLDLRAIFLLDGLLYAAALVWAWRGLEPIPTPPPGFAAETRSTHRRLTIGD